MQLGPFSHVRSRLEAANKALQTGNYLGAERKTRNVYR